MILLYSIDRSHLEISCWLTLSNGNSKDISLPCLCTFFLPTPFGMWNLNSLTRARTAIACIGSSAS